MAQENNDPMDVDGRAPSRGSEQKAHAGLLSPSRIRALDPDVVNKIAAGEIILSPSHALKELLENAIDAGSTSLEVVVKEGGLKLLQITDNGHGINKDDLPILCERFTTSKLKDFEDLTSIGTYGFRGEALASISHIAHLQVTTKTKNSDCAWRAHYSSGTLIPAKPGQNADPKPTAGRQGTQITVEDLFYNIPSRRRAFRSATDEYNKILDLIGRYAVHCSSVTFSCKKYGESSLSIATQSSSTTIDRIRQIHGNAIASELIEFKSEDERWGFSAHGWVSNANYNVKRTTLLLFVNHRSIESTNIKKAIDLTYSNFLPKGGHPFVYMSLDIEPQRVDVNVHPTKREVNFLNEDEIIDKICGDIRAKLADVDTSRSFHIQTLLPGAQPREDEDVQASRQQDARSAKRPYEHNLVRTDSKLRKITTMLPLSTTSIATTGQASAGQNSIPNAITYSISEREATTCRLISVKELRAEVRDTMHGALTDIIGSHSFVGIVDERRRLAAIQADVRLFLIDYGMMSFDFFYQVGLTHFMNFGTIQLDPPLDLRSLLRLATDVEKEASSDMNDVPVDEVVEAVATQLLERRDMLLEYFSLDINDDAQLCGLPLLLKGYLPSMAKMPRFLLRLGPHVDWTDEKACFSSFLRELAIFYVPEQLPPLPTTADGEVEEDIGDEIKARRAHVRKVVEDVIFPACRARLVATDAFMKGGVLEVANLKGLYRVFERC